jgi:uncharacterized DUF497 family protein
MLESVNGFDWDEGNSEKCWKRVPKEDIESLFQQPGILIAPDIKHSQDEERYLAIGVLNQERYIFVAFTFRNKEDEALIRPISARYMRDKEVQKYEQNFPQT